MIQLPLLNSFAVNFKGSCGIIFRLIFRKLEIKRAKLTRTNARTVWYLQPRLKSIWVYKIKKYAEEIWLRLELPCDFEYLVLRYSSLDLGLERLKDLLWRLGNCYAGGERMRSFFEKRE